MFAVLPNKYKPLVVVAMNTGLRKTEQLSLKWTDIDFKLGQINKTVEQSFARLPRRINNAFVFSGRKPGGRLLDLPNDWEEFLQKAKIEDFHWHDLRHTFASRLVMAGVDLYTVRKSARSSRH